MHTSRRGVSIIGGLERAEDLTVPLNKFRVH